MDREDIPGWRECLGTLKGENHTSSDGRKGVTCKVQAWPQCSAERQPSGEDEDYLICCAWAMWRAGQVQVRKVIRSPGREWNGKTGERC